MAKIKKYFILLHLYFNNQYYLSLRSGSDYLDLQKKTKENITGLSLAMSENPTLADAGGVPGIL